MTRTFGIPCWTLITFIFFISAAHSVTGVRQQTTDASNPVTQGRDSQLSSRPLIEGLSSIDSESRPFDPLIVEGDAVSTGRQITFERKSLPDDIYEHSASEEGGRWRWPESSEATHTHHSQSWTHVSHNNDEDNNSELGISEMTPGLQPGEVNYLNRKPGEGVIEDSLTHSEEAVHVEESFPEHLPVLDITEEVLFTPSDPKHLEVNAAVDMPEHSAISDEETLSQETTPSSEKEFLAKSTLPPTIEDFWSTSTTSANDLRHFNPTLIVKFSHINKTESSTSAISPSVNSIPEHKETVLCLDCNDQTTRFTLHTRKPSTTADKSVTNTNPNNSIDTSTSANRHSKFIPPSHPKSFKTTQSSNNTVSNKVTTNSANNPGIKFSANIVSTDATKSAEDSTLPSSPKESSDINHKSFQQSASPSIHSSLFVNPTELPQPINQWNTATESSISITHDISTNAMMPNHSLENNKFSVFPPFAKAVNMSAFQTILSSTAKSFSVTSTTSIPTKEQTTVKAVPTNIPDSSEQPNTTAATSSLETDSTVLKLFTFLVTQSSTFPLTDSLPTISTAMTIPTSTNMPSTSESNHFSLLETSSLPTATDLSGLITARPSIPISVPSPTISSKTLVFSTVPSVLTQSSRSEKFSIPTVPSLSTDTTLLRPIQRKKIPDPTLTTPFHPTIRSRNGTMPSFLYSTQPTIQLFSPSKSITPSEKESSEASGEVHFDEDSNDSHLISSSTTNTIIISSVIGGCAILFFAFLMIFCMWKQRVNRRARFRQPELGIINQLNGKH